MTFSTPWRFSLAPAGLALLVLLTPFAGCGRNDVQTYRVPKEAKKSTMPNGWEEAPPGEMRVASFRVRGENGKNAEVSVIPLPGMAGTDLANVNRWRGQVGASTVTEAELPGLAKPVDVNGEKGQLFEQAGKNPASGDATRILAAIVRKDGAAWFFKMTGDDSLVEKQKPAFLGYLKTFNWPAGGDSSAAGEAQLPPSHPPIGNLSSAAASAASAPNPDKPEWKAPEGWKEVDGGAFLISKFLISSSGGDAAVNVSMSAGEGGGLAANVNRWRKQLGLDELGNDQIADQSKVVDIPGGKATFVDMSGTDARAGQKARLVGAIVPRGERTWFYKLMGASAVVEQNNEAFVTFVKGVKYK